MPTVVLSVSELAAMTLHIPWLFIANGGMWRAIGLLRTSDGTVCPWLAPDGRWLPEDLPILFRLYPFTVLPDEDRFRMGVWDDPDCIGEKGTNIFDGEALAPELAPVVKRLSQFTSGVAEIQKIAEALFEAGVLHPSKIGHSGQAKLFSVDETALRELNGQSLEALSATGALGAAHAQLLSLRHISKLTTGAEPSVPTMPGAPDAPEASFLNAVVQDLETDVAFELGLLET